MAARRKIDGLMDHVLDVDDPNPDEVHLNVENKKKKMFYETVRPILERHQRDSEDFKQGLDGIIEPALTPSTRKTNESSRETHNNKSHAVIRLCRRF